ncbi:MAG: hypothetical protein IIY93_01170 [Clostridia bacterium]|nr:hypothetical protein [Clostridia bacterium]MBQ1554418.1 hypothetical protein [Clostridia bacterium]
MMKQSKWLKILLTVVYGIGVGCNLYLLLMMCLHPHHVEAPDAMLPMTDFERAFVMMASGFLPMTASALSMIWVYALKQTRHPRRNSGLMLLPAMVDAIPFVFMVGLVIVMMAETVLEILGILH